MSLATGMCPNVQVHFYWKRNEQCFRILWDNLKKLKIHVIGVPSQKVKRKICVKKIKKKKIEDRMAENVPNLVKDINLQIKESQWIPNRISSTTTTQPHWVPRPPCCQPALVSLWDHLTDFLFSSLGTFGILSKFGLYPELLNIMLWESGSC